ncbi:tripartite tricarboxylate transporter TctB family protein [Kiritimatiella glycovorans]|uniref:Tripartite tricarboxylate transporter TctB family protein n=1 Tax=Kiritimatiella glycovorans TaxID=1307763 RepID=A0A0G3EF06_9BACT|nr:tripartite tricarboxylate transporter TctB family protein [Kiritimatiella glycovorans]AKJ64913.1 Tripartite tricarboxylate transporter TctB family protein [Kiritimatiella glycovorans]
MKRRTTIERMAYLVVLIIGAGTVGLSLTFPRPEDAHSGPGSFPLFLGVLLAALALGGLIGTLRNPPESGAAEEAGDGRRLPLLGGLTALYLVLMPWLGFISSTALLFAAALRVLGYRNPVRALAAGFIAAFVLYAVFERLMNVALPEGWIG